MKHLSSLFLLSSGALALPTFEKHNKGMVEFDLHKTVKNHVDTTKINFPVSSKHGDDHLVTAQLGNKQFYYQIQLGIGTPAQLVDFTIDTGSSDLWVMSSSNPYCSTNASNTTAINCTGSIFSPELSSTYRTLDRPFAIQYGDRTMANGSLGLDTIRLGEAVLYNATFAVADIVNSSTCVFGIGFIGDEAEAHVHKNGSGVYPTYFNVPTMMKQQGIIETNAYSLWLNDMDADFGSILFGGIDTAKYDGDLHVMPIFNNYHEYTDRPIQTRVMLNGINIDGHPLADFNIAILLDSGTSFDYLPEDVLHAMGQSLGFVYNPDIGYYFGGIETALGNGKYFNLNFSGASIDVPVTDLLIPLNYDDGTSVIADGEEQAILAVGIASDDYMYILGDIFLRSMYAVFDLDHYEIALGKAKMNVTDSNFSVIGPSIPGAIPVPHYAHTSTNNSSFHIHDYTPATPAPSMAALTLTIPLVQTSEPTSTSTLTTSISTASSNNHVTTSSTNISSTVASNVNISSIDTFSAPFNNSLFPVMSQKRSVATATSVDPNALTTTSSATVTTSSHTTSTINPHVRTLTFVTVHTSARTLTASSYQVITLYSTSERASTIKETKTSTGFSLEASVIPITYSTDSSSTLKQFVITSPEVSLAGATLTVPSVSATTLAEISAVALPGTTALLTVTTGSSTTITTPPAPVPECSPQWWVQMPDGQFIPESQINMVLGPDITGNHHGYQATYGCPVYESPKPAQQYITTSVYVKFTQPPVVDYYAPPAVYVVPPPAYIQPVYGYTGPVPVAAPPASNQGCCVGNHCPVAALRQIINN